MKSWGVAANLPEGPFVPHDFGEVIRFNRDVYPNVRFALISSYADRIMSFFSFALGAPSPGTTVRDTLVDVANNQIGNVPHAKVFYMDDTAHTYMAQKLSSVKSLDVTLNDWVSSMLEETNKVVWDNVRPDLHQRVHTADEEGYPRSIDAIRGSPSQF
jgi:hypothetical protein